MGDDTPPVIYNAGTTDRVRTESDIAFNWGCVGMVLGFVFGVFTCLSVAFVYREFIR